MSRPRRIARQSVIHLNMFFYSHPRLKAFALRWLAPFPGLKAWLKMVGHQPLPKSRSLTIGGQEYLTPHARRIYADLKAVIERSGQKENG